MRKTTTTAAIALATAGLLLTGCGGSSTTSTPDEPGIATTAAAAIPPSVPAAPSRPIGQAWNWSNSTGAKGSTTVLSYTQPVTSLDPPDTSLGVPTGSQWGRLDIKVCQTGGPSIGVSQTPWSLAFADGSRADVTGLFGGNFPKPEWPQDATVNAGQCVRGGIMFPIPAGQWPTRVVYAPVSAPAPVEWAIPAQ